MWLDLCAGRTPARTTPFAVSAAGRLLVGLHPRVARELEVSVNRQATCAAQQRGGDVSGLKDGAAGEFVVGIGEGPALVERGAGDRALEDAAIGGIAPKAGGGQVLEQQGERSLDHMDACRGIIAHDPAEDPESDGGSSGEAGA